MKPRIKVDSLLAAAAVIVTVILYMFPRFYSQASMDSVLDFFGIIILLKGIMFRMAARAHKKANSKNSERLVTTGSYLLVRNPMYLGTFMIGVGFLLCVWPWWMTPVFIGLFYWRFIKQIKIEEQVLLKAFGQEYEDFCRNVPRLFPRYSTAFKTKTKDILDLDEMFTTKETRALFLLPMAAVGLEIVQEFVIYGSTDIIQTIVAALSAALVFFVGFILFYRFK